MEDNKFENKILEKIKTSHITPTSRWHFVLKNYLIWLSGSLALIASGAAISIMVYFFNYNDISLRGQINKSLAEMLLLTLPYLWIVFLSIFIFIVYFNLKHTKNGYRYPIWLIAVLAFATSIFLGGIFTFAGWGEKIDETLEQGAPLYSEVMNPHLDFWSNPQEGRLMGVVISDVENGEFNLVDKDQKEWSISLNSEEIIETPIGIAQPVKVLGEQKSEDVFEATLILPVMPGRGFFKRMRPDLLLPPLDNENVPMFENNNNEDRGGGGSKMYKNIK